MSEQDNKPQAPQTPDETPGVQEDLLTGHVYDGIQEYDNPTPAWMTWIFIAFAVFTPIYLIFTLMSDGGLTPHGQLERASVANLEKKFGELGELQPDAATILKYSTDEQWVAFGENVFQTHCISCHGASAGGGSAPNLTDDAFINVKDIEDIVVVVRDGANNGAMPAWGNRLHPNEVVLVSSYVASLKGTDVANGKGPEGEVIPDWSAGDAPEPDATEQEQ